jgi:beta-xylosidase
MRTVESSAGLWAPTLRYYKGRVYMICSCFWRLRVDKVRVWGRAPLIPDASSHL